MAKNPGNPANSMSSPANFSGLKVLNGLHPAGRPGAGAGTRKPDFTADSDDPSGAQTGKGAKGGFMDTDD